MMHGLPVFAPSGRKQDEFLITLDGCRALTPTRKAALSRLHEAWSLPRHGQANGELGDETRSKDLVYELVREFGEHAVCLEEASLAQKTLPSELGLCYAEGRLAQKMTHSELAPCYAPRRMSSVNTRSGAALAVAFEERPPWHAAIFEKRPPPHGLRLFCISQTDLAVCRSGRVARCNSRLTLDGFG